MTFSNQLRQGYEKIKLNYSIRKEFDKAIEQAKGGGLSLYAAVVDFNTTENPRMNSIATIVGRMIEKHRDNPQAINMIAERAERLGEKSKSQAKNAVAGVVFAQLTQLPYNNAEIADLFFKAAIYCERAEVFQQAVEIAMHGAKYYIESDLEHELKKRKIEEIMGLVATNLEKLQQEYDDLKMPFNAAIMRQNVVDTLQQVNDRYRQYAAFASEKLR